MLRQYHSKTAADKQYSTWSYKLGAEILTPVGRQQLFDSGVLHQYQYGGLYKPDTKIVARTTSQDRILKVWPYLLGILLNSLSEHGA